MCTFDHCGDGCKYTPDFLLFCPSSLGGIPDYAHHQAEALGSTGCRVTMLCPEDFPHLAKSYRQDRCFLKATRRSGPRLARAAKLAMTMLAGYQILEHKIRETGAKHVLMSTYSEYLGPLWAWRLRRLRKQGVIFGAVAHDPVRDFVVGPLWWHRRSISSGYSYLNHVFVHEPIDLDTGSPEQQVLTHVIPHGPYPFPEPVRPREETRLALEIPENAPLFLSFGHLRDGKNLNLILEAMTQIPEAWLLVAGTEAGNSHSKSQDYQNLATSLGVAERCRWEIGFASPETTADFFTAADFVLLTYSATFRSASGVLNLAVRYQKPVVASCGESNLASCVERYHLGVRVGADQREEIARGMRKLIIEVIEPNWNKYGMDNSWTTNAQLVQMAFEPSC